MTKHRRNGATGGKIKKPNSSALYGAIAQLGERIVRNDEVVGSIPTSSTNLLNGYPLGSGRHFLSPNFSLFLKKTTFSTATGFFANNARTPLRRMPINRAG